MLHRRNPYIPSHVAVLAGALLAMAGCAPLPRERVVALPAPLHLLGAESLELPKGCEPVTRY